ncbi:MAG: putative sulfate exporter family transporter, partial [Clostridiales bacterium]|nr:putative sulfate exporter family transporter [Clostridiales bacterium]
VAAGTTWSNAAGNNTALAFATIVKLTRTLMIVPVTLVLAIYTVRREHKKTGTSNDVPFSFAKVFPWFVLGFIAAAILNTCFDMTATSSFLVTAGKFMIVMAMVAVGLNTNLKKLVTNGIKPIFLGLCCWFAVAGVSILVQKCILFF